MSQRLESEAEVWVVFALFNFKVDVVDVVDARDNEHQNTCSAEPGSNMGEFCLVFIFDSCYIQTLRYVLQIPPGASFWSNGAVPRCV